MQRRSSGRVVVVLALVALAALLAWVVSSRERAARGGPEADAPGASPPPARAEAGAPDAAQAAARPPAQPPRPMVAPALQLARAVTVRPAPPAAPGALEGKVVDAKTDEGIAAAELTFSHHDGAYSTTSGPGGAFRFAPAAAGTYRLVAVDAKGYASFEGEFGRSPVSFTSVPGSDVTAVVLRLSRGTGSRAAAASGRADDDGAAGGPDRGAADPDGGAADPDGGRAAGSLRGRVVEARSGAPVAAFAVAIWRRAGLAYAGSVAPASFIDPAGEYQIDGLSPGTYEATALAAGYASSSYALVQIADGPAEANFSLHSGARVAGSVSDAATGRPVAGAAISLEGRRGDSPDLPAAPLSPVAQTGADGAFALEHVAPDAISLRAERPGYLTRLVPLGALPADGDAPPFSIALTPQEPGTDGGVETTGIGAALRAREDFLEVVQVLPGGGAADAGLVVGDEVLRIDGVKVTDLGFERSIGAIRGPVGTTVALHLRRAAGESDLVVIRKLVRS